MIYNKHYRVSMQGAGVEGAALQVATAEPSGGSGLRRRRLRNHASAGRWIAHVQAEKFTHIFNFHIMSNTSNPMCFSFFRNSDDLGKNTYTFFAHKPGIRCIIMHKMYQKSCISRLNCSSLQGRRKPTGTHLRNPLKTTKKSTMHCMKIPC